MDALIVSLAGVVAAAGLAWYFFGPRTARQAEVRGRIQEVAIVVKGGYSPDLIRVRQGVPLRLVFDRQEGSDCTSRVVFPDFQLSKSLPAFQKTVVELAPDRAGEFQFACGMGMVHGRLIVEERAVAEPAPSSPVRDADVAEAVGIGPSIKVSEPARVEFALETGALTCPSCVVRIEHSLQSMAAVDRAGVNIGSERVVTTRPRPRSPTFGVRLRLRGTRSVKSGPLPPERTPR